MKAAPFEPGNPTSATCSGAGFNARISSRLPRICPLKLIRMSVPSLLRKLLDIDELIGRCDAALAEVAFVVFARSGSAINRRRRRQRIRTHFDLAKACPVTGMVLFEIDWEAARPSLGARSVAAGNASMPSWTSCRRRSAMAPPAVCAPSHGYVNFGSVTLCLRLVMSPRVRFAPSRSSRRRLRRRDRRVPLHFFRRSSRDCRARLCSAIAITHLRSLR